MTATSPTVRLGDVVSLQVGFPFRSSSYTTHSSAPRLLRGDNIGQGVPPLEWCETMADGGHSGRERLLAA